MDDAEKALNISVKERERVLDSGPSLIKQRRKVLPDPGALESLASEQSGGGLSLIPRPENRQKNENNVIVSKGFEKRRDPESERVNETIFPAKVLVSGVSGAG